MEILIIDRDEQFAMNLCAMLKEYNPVDMTLQIAKSGNELCQLLQHKPRLDLIFLDLTLGEKFGIDIFKEFLVECPLILLTNNVNFSLKPGFLFCIDYLVKPITELSLAKALLKYERFKSILTGASFSQYSSLLPNSTLAYKNRFLIRLGSRMFFVNTIDIVYFYVGEKTVYLVNNEGSRYPIDYSLEKVQKMVDPSIFFRVNRKVICSTNAIREIKTHLNSRLKIVLSVGHYMDEVVVSREKVAAFKEWVEG